MYKCNVGIDMSNAEPDADGIKWGRRVLRSDVTSKQINAVNCCSIALR